MIEPTLALQTAIRSRLISKPEVMVLLEDDPTRVRSGSTRPDIMPCVIMSDGNTALHGHDYTAQRTAWVYLDLHIWTLDAGQDAAKEIAGAVIAALDKPLNFEGCDCDHFRVTRSTFSRDPTPGYGHGVLSVEAFIRWIL
ncbi:DUF3168 domain-containing protein [Rhizobium leguminosarum]|uniref:DUF3168 domain-containing protein n=1 Tax=Rhizobium leguminosarum TaxID=384 RepID=UPI00103010DE|nr:DUF3168 domain-containing protein [Rhizobium leguminosarum]TAY66492.1 DUF3168 domain-containing protein [Rhizobium leguminosarum]